MAKTNGLRKKHSNHSKKNMVVCACVFFLYLRWGLQKRNKTTFQKSQTPEQIIKNIAGAVTMYHDH